MKFAVSRAGWIRLGLVTALVLALEAACRLGWIDPVAVMRGDHCQAGEEGPLITRLEQIRMIHRGEDSDAK